MYSSVSSYLWMEHRKILTPNESGLSCLPCFGLCSHQQARRPLERHFHPGCMEIVLIIKGFQTYEVNGEAFSLSGSDVFITWPDEIHSSGTQPENVCEMIWMQIDLSPDKPFFSLNDTRGALLRESLLSLPRLFTGDDSVCRELRNAFFYWPDKMNSNAFKANSCWSARFNGSFSLPEKRRRADWI